MDRSNLYVVEISKDKFIVQEKDIANISNCLSLNSSIKEDKIYKFFAKSQKRQKTVNEQLRNDIDVKDAMSILRSHNSKNYMNGSVSSVCMHAGKLIGDHTTNSMIVELLNNKIVIYATMGSLPCLSIYKKGIFGQDNFLANDKHYIEIELLKRSIFLRKISLEFYEERDNIENDIINNKIAFKDALKKETNLLKKAVKKLPITKKEKRYWKNKTKIFKEENYVNS